MTCGECTDAVVMSDPVARQAYRANLSARVRRETLAEAAHVCAIYAQDVTGPREYQPTSDEYAKRAGGLECERRIRALMSST
jgi:hypothetical protein